VTTLDWGSLPPGSPIPLPPAVEKLFSDKDVDSKISNITIAWTALHACDEKQETVKISRDFRTTHCSVVDKAQHSAWLNCTQIRWLLRQSQVTQSQQQAEYLTVFNRHIASKTKTWLHAINNAVTGIVIIRKCTILHQNQQGWILESQIFYCLSSKGPQLGRKPFLRSWQHNVQWSLAFGTRTLQAADPYIKS